MSKDIIRVGLGDLTYKKSDDGTLFVYGKATGPDLDLDQQICDPEWLKTAMPQWMATGANVREMHESIAAGVGIELAASGDDWFLKSEVVDSNTAKKVERGVLKGYSIGIKNARVVTDDSAPNGRIVAGQIVEVSLVDRPANPTATVEIAKRVGNKLTLTKGIDLEPLIPDTQRGHGPTEMAQEVQVHTVPSSRSEGEYPAALPCDACNGLGRTADTNEVCVICDGKGVKQEFPEAADQRNSRAHQDHDGKAEDEGVKAADADVVKYNPEQERDEHGRFSSGSSESDALDRIAEGKGTADDHKLVAEAHRDAFEKLENVNIHDGAERHYEAAKANDRAASAIRLGKADADAKSLTALMASGAALGEGADKAVRADIEKEREYARDAHGRFTSGSAEDVALGKIAEGKGTASDHFVVADAHIDAANKLEDENYHKEAQAHRDAADAHEKAGAANTPGSSRERLGRFLARTAADASNAALGSADKAVRADIEKDQPRDELGRFAESGLSATVGKDNPGNRAYSGPMLAQHLQTGDRVRNVGVLRQPGVVTSAQKNSDGSVTAQFDRVGGGYLGSQKFDGNDVIQVNRSSKNLSADVEKMEHNSADLSSVRQSLVNLLKAELDELANGEENEIADVKNLLTALDTFLNWWQHEAQENETDFPFPQSSMTYGGDTMAYIGLGVSADLIKRVTSEEASDADKTELRAEIRKALGVDEEIATYKATLKEQQESITVLKAALDEVREMATPGGPVLRATHAQAAKSADAERMKAEAARYRAIADGLTDPTTKAAYITKATEMEADAARILRG